MSGVAHARNLLGPLLHRWYRFRVVGIHRLPRRGPVLLVASQRSILDPTIIATSLTRPVRVVIEDAEGIPRWGGLSSALGRIDLPAESSPWPALQRGVEALDQGGAVGCFIHSEVSPPRLQPEAAIAGYLRCRTEATVIPISIFGSHGPRPTDPPKPRSTIDVVVGDPMQLPQVDDPHARSSVVMVAEAIRQSLVDAEQIASARVGIADLGNQTGSDLT